MLTLCKRTIGQISLGRQLGGDVVQLAPTERIE
jgi:hypothetical protein